MSNFPYHRPPEWELFRNESVKSQKFRKAVADAHASADSTRTAGSGLWWPEQRWVNQVVPAETVNPDNFDTFNYRYQVYARPPPVQCEPQSLAEVTDEKPSIQYNVKRIAMDKPCTQAPRECEAHWTSKPWILTDNPCDQRGSTCGRTPGTDCTQNNNVQVRNFNQSDNDVLSTSCNYRQDTFIDVTDTGLCEGPSTMICRITHVDALESPLVDTELLSCSLNNNACMPRGDCDSSSVSMRACPPTPEEEKEIDIALKIARPKHIHPGIDYGTYKLIASKQHNIPNAPLYDREAPLPPDLEEYREFTRRCPNPKVGRYDRTDPLMEMLLPANRTSVNMAASHTPFHFCRNPKAGKLPPLFRKLPQPSLEWTLPTFIAK